MLRDGTETIALEDGTNRILNSGTGGKVDIYVLGRKIEPLTESYIFTDLSGSGNISDEKNDFVLGQGNQDETRTSEERRVLAFRNGVLPAQPVDSVISVVGSQSGRLTEAFFDELGVKSGNFEIIKDLNPETGGSPFGFDKIHFISSKKSVTGESITKGSAFGFDAPSFVDISDIKSIYIDEVEKSENPSVSKASSKFLELSHTPVVKVSRVRNQTTGEVYSIVDRNLNDNGLNESGVIEISGRSLPIPSHILSVDYTWRRYFDKDIDFSGGDRYQFKDSSSGDNIDWSQSGGISEEESIITKSADGLSYIVELNSPVSRAISIYFKDSVESIISELLTSSGSTISGVIIPDDEETVDSIISIKRISDGLELYNSEKNNGSFSSREIYLPSDSQGKLGETVLVDYNKVELFNVENSDGSSFDKTVVLPSIGVLSQSNIEEAVDSAFLSEDPVYATYILDSTVVYPKVFLSSLPILGSETLDTLTTSSGSGSDGSNQPIFFNRESILSGDQITRFGPSQLSIKLSDIESRGKVKILGTSLNKYVFDIRAGTNVTGLIVDLNSEIKAALSIDSIPDSIGIAKIYSVSKLDRDGAVLSQFDKLGCALKSVKFSTGTATLDSTLQNYQFILPTTSVNNAISLTSSDMIRVEVLIRNDIENEEVFFDKDSERFTKNRYGLIDTISISSGLRDRLGGISGAIEVLSLNQPDLSEQYLLDYDFLSPKEGERITVSYNINKVIIDATTQIEGVRPITADVLIKEAQEIMVDVYGTILINDDALSNADSILENASNAVSNLLTTTSLGQTIDYSDIISVVASQDGVDSVNISIFNETEKSGRRPFIRAFENQFISPGVISLESVSRNKFKIN